MSDLKRRIFDWLDHRTGVETAIKDFFYEEIPGSSGWHQVFGSIALFLFMVQAFTGVLLAVNYAPTPGDAYNSLKYIVTEVTGGRLIHGLHHWGASMIIVIVVVHMIQVFVYGSYKKPREATWMVGVVLLLVVLGFGLTGYLLPWDNRAYWGHRRLNALRRPSAARGRLYGTPFGHHKRQRGRRNLCALLRAACSGSTPGHHWIDRFPRLSGAQAWRSARPG